MSRGTAGIDEQLRFVIDSIPGLICLVDKDLCYLAANKAYADWFSRRTDEIPGLSMRDVLGAEMFAGVESSLAEALDGRQLSFGRHFIHRGEQRDVRATYVPRFDSAGDVSGLLIRIADITAQATAERALQESDEQFRTLLANTPDIISRFDREYRFLYISPAVEKVLGLAQEFHIGKRHEEAGVPPELSQRLEAVLEEIFVTGERRTVTFLMPGQDGVLRHYEGLGIPECGSDGTVRTVLTIVRDTSAQFEAAERLRESEARFRAMVETASEGIWMIDPDGITTFANRRMCELLGCTEPELMGRSCYEFLFPDEVERGKRGVEARKQGSILPTEYRARRQDGTPLWLQFTAAPMRNAQGDIAGLLGMCTDVTERVERDALLRASEERYRSLVTATSSIVWTAAPDGSMSGDTSAWTVYKGKPVPRGPQPWGAFLHPEDIAGAHHAWEIAADAKGVLEHTARIWNEAENEYRWCVTRAVPLRHADGAIREWIGTTTDIHDRREAEAHYEALFSSSRDGILIVNDNGEYVDVNPAYCSLLKSTREDLLGRVFVPFIPADRVAAAQQAFVTLKRDGRYTGEFIAGRGWQHCRTRVGFFREFRSRFALLHGSRYHGTETLRSAAAADSKAGKPGSTGGRDRARLQ